VATAAVAPGLAVGLAVPALASAGPVGLTGLAALAGGVLWRPPPLAAAIPAVVAALAGFLWSAHGLAVLQRDPLASLVGSRVRGTAVVTGDVHQGGSTWSAVAVLDGRKVELRGTEILETGEIAAVEGRLGRPRPPLGRGSFDEREWLARLGVHEVLRVRVLRRIGRRGGVDGFVDRMRAGAARALRAAGDDEPSRVAGGILLGTSGALAPDTRAAFRRSGLQHLLAVSGGNVALLVAVVLALAWMAGLPRAAAHALAVPTVIAYAAVVGPGPSVVRAAVAGVLASLTWLAGRPRDRWHALAVGAAVVQALDPFGVLEPGAQLSFVAVAAMFALAPWLEERLAGRPFPDVLRRPAALSAACTLATAPIAYWHFGRASLIGSLPANLLALPLVAPILWLGLASVALWPVLPAASVALDTANRVPAALLIAVAKAGAWLDTTGGSIVSAIGWLR
jgi:competence protein ComEC